MLLGRLLALLAKFLDFAQTSAPDAVVGLASLVIVQLVNGGETCLADVCVGCLFALELAPGVIPLLLAPVALDPVLAIGLRLLVLRVHLVAMITIAVIVAQVETRVTVGELAVVALVPAVFLPFDWHATQRVRTQQLRFAGGARF